MDDEMVALARAGDPRACRELGRWLDQQLRAYFSQRFRAEHVPELVQDTSVYVLERLQNAAPWEGTFEGWVLSCAHFHVLRWFDSRTRERRHADLRAEFAAMMPAGRSFDEAQYGAEEHLRVMLQIAEDLSAKLHGAFLAYLAGYSHQEIAESFGINEGAARARVHAAKRRVAQRWKRDRLTRTPFRSPRERSRA